MALARDMADWTRCRAPWLERIWKGTYAPDYIGLFVLLISYISIVVFVEPFHRMFFINDMAISYPYAQVERVSVTMNFVYALFLPLGIMILYNMVRRSPAQKHEATYLSFFISVLLTSFLTDFIKNAAGRPRPDLISRCNPSPDTPANKLVTIDVCMETAHHRLHDGWRSFPSGHASFSFSGLGYLSFFLAGQLHVFLPARGGRDLSRALVCLAPLLGAAMIGITRLEDYRHDVYDVCFGGLLGLVVAYWSYRRHWPSLTSASCDQPHPKPSEVMAGTSSGWSRIRDEEEAVGTENVGYEMTSLS